MRSDDDWRKIVRDLDPLRVLEEHEVAALYAQRPDSASDEIADEVELSTEPEHLRLALAGARGAGKTTELLRLRQRFGSGGRHVVVPVYLDIAGVLPEHAATRAWLPLLAVAIRAVRQGWTPPRPGEEFELIFEGLGVGRQVVSHALGAIHQVATWVKGPVAAAVAVRAQAEGVPADLATTVSSGAVDEAVRTLAGLVPEAPADDSAVEALLATIRDDLEEIRASAGRPVLLLLDGLDKRNSVESVLAALDEAELLYRIPASLVLSGPMQLSLDPRFAAQILPGRFRCVVQHNLPVVNRDGRPKESGISVLRDLFQRRWKGTGLVGPPVLPEPLIDVAARWSSGIVREFLEILRSTARAARRAQRDVADAADLAVAVRDRRLDYGRTVTHELWNDLAQVLRTGERPRAELDDLLFTNRIACYPNDDAWFRPNELLVPHLEQRADGEGDAR